MVHFSLLLQLCNFVGASLSCNTVQQLKNEILKVTNQVCTNYTEVLSRAQTVRTPLLGLSTQVMKGFSTYTIKWFNSYQRFVVCWNRSAICYLSVNQFLLLRNWIAPFYHICSQRIPHIRQMKLHIPYYSQKLKHQCIFLLYFKEKQNLPLFSVLFIPSGLVCCIAFEVVKENMRSLLPNHHEQSIKFYVFICHPCGYLPTRIFYDAMSLKTFFKR